MTSIRNASLQDLNEINTLLRQSKAHWGYDKAFLDKFMDKLAITQKHIQSQMLRLFYINNQLAGFYNFDINPEGFFELENFFLHPDFIGQGFGRKLWTICCDEAKARGKNAFIIWSDPHAMNFYLKMGCEKIGERASPMMPDRFPPVLKCKLDPINLHLTGEKIRLETLEAEHYALLFNAAQDANIWTYNGSNGFGDKFANWFENAMLDFNQQLALPFVVRRLADNEILGSTRLYHINEKHKRLTVGYTWYIPAVWGSYVNPESKLLLLKFAFEQLKMNRVEFITDTRNKRSQAAILKLGAIEEGRLRQHMVLENGNLRDTLVFSILNNEWSGVKEKLLERLKH